MWIGNDLSWIRDPTFEVITNPDLIFRQVRLNILLILSVHNMTSAKNIDYVVTVEFNQWEHTVDLPIRAGQNVRDPTKNSRPDPSLFELVG